MGHGDLRSCQCCTEKGGAEVLNRRHASACPRSKASRSSAPRTTSHPPTTKGPAARISSSAPPGDRAGDRAPTASITVRRGWSAMSRTASVHGGLIPSEEGPGGRACSRPGMMSGERGDAMRSRCGGRRRDPGHRRGACPRLAPLPTVSRGTGQHVGIGSRTAPRPTQGQRTPGRAPGAPGSGIAEGLAIASSLNVPAAGQQTPWHSAVIQWR